MLPLLALVGNAVGNLLRRVMRALAEPPRSQARELPPEWFKFPLY